LRLYLLRLLQPSIDGRGIAAFGSGDEEREEFPGGEDEMGESPESGVYLCSSNHQCCFLRVFDVVGISWPFLSAILLLLGRGTVVLRCCHQTQMNSVFGNFQGNFQGNFHSSV